MAGHNTANMDALIRSEIWSHDLKEALTDSLMAQNYVKWLSEFPDGNTFTIPSIGDMESQDYAEDQAVQYQAVDTGEFQFSITEYVQSGTYITNKAKQDLFYMNELVSSFVPKMQRAIAERVERDIWKQGQPVTGNPAGSQVAGNANRINGADHRWVAQGTVNSNAAIDVKDFAKALYSLKKANIPQRNLIAIVDPSVEYTINTLTNLTNVSNNPQWQGIIEGGIAQDMRFLRNIYGFDVYTCNRLPLCGANQAGTSETINSKASGANAVANLFFSADQSILPWIGAWRQMPKVDGEYNKDFQREEYVTTARYGVKTYRPENLITVLSSTDVIV